MGYQIPTPNNISPSSYLILLICLNLNYMINGCPLRYLVPFAWISFFLIYKLICCLKLLLLIEAVPLNKTHTHKEKSTIFRIKLFSSTCMESACLSHRPHLLNHSLSFILLGLYFNLFDCSVTGGIQQSINPSTSRQDQSDLNFIRRTVWQLSKRRDTEPVGILMKIIPVNGQMDVGKI